MNLIHISCAIALGSVLLFGPGAVAGNEPGCGGLCAPDFNFDGSVDGGDLGILLDSYGGSGCGDASGDGVVDGADLGILLALWGPCQNDGCVPDADGDCCSAHFSPGCIDVDCCETICALDAFCCEVSWDALCVSQAGVNPACGCEPGA